jgi:hypothetical protein
MAFIGEPWPTNNTGIFASCSGRLSARVFREGRVSMATADSDIFLRKSLRFMARRTV